MRVKVKNWNAVGTWVWDIENQTDCTICQFPLESPCSKCKFPGDDCPPIQGMCNHHFHLHCMIRWTEVNETCPLCKEKWVVKSQ